MIHFDVNSSSPHKNNHSSTSDRWEYSKSCFKENARTFSKNSTIQENIRISRLKKRLRNLNKKENFKPKIKPMIENFQDELYRLESKQAKVLNFMLTSGGNWRKKEAPRLFPKHLKDRICNIKQYLNYIAMTINKKTFSNPKDIIKSAKNVTKKFKPRRQLPKLLLLNFLSKFLTERKYIINDLSFARQKYL